MIRQTTGARKDLAILRATIVILYIFMAGCDDLSGSPQHSVNPRQISVGEMEIHNIKIGDESEKVVKLYGKPDLEEFSWSYLRKDYIWLSVTVEDDKVIGVLGGQLRWKGHLFRSGDPPDDFFRVFPPPHGPDGSWGDEEIELRDGWLGISTHSRELGTFSVRLKKNDE